MLRIAATIAVLIIWGRGEFYGMLKSQNGSLVESGIIIWFLVLTLIGIWLKGG